MTQTPADFADPNVANADPAPNSPPHEGGVGDSLSASFDDLLEQGNRAAAAAQSQAEQLTWPAEPLIISENGRERTLEPVELLWTAGREALFEALQSADGGGADAPRELARGPLDARILLFLAAHPAEVWTEKIGREAPLRSNYSRFLAAIDAWADERIPAPIRYDSVGVASELLRLSGTTVAVRTAKSAGAAKKKPNQAL